ncbi:MAG: FHA domain-containing protein [Gemmataceae bacterium]
MGNQPEGTSIVEDQMMSMEPNGELIPIGGGDPIPLNRPHLTVGRRDTCDICLHFSNISGLHCELLFHDGFWIIRDLGSTNGTRVNLERIRQKTLFPGDEITIAKRRFTIQYTPAAGVPAPDDSLEDDEDDILSQPLLERAGLSRPPRALPKRRTVRIVNRPPDAPEDDA